VRISVRSIKTLILVGVSLIATGAAIYFFRYPLRARGSWMIVSTVDADGVPVGRAGLVRVPEPETVVHDGMSQVGPFVTRLMSSRGGFISLIVSTPDGQMGFGVFTERGRARLSLNVDWRAEPERERAIRGLFAGLGIAPSEDYLAGNGGVRDATRILTYPAPDGPPKLAALSRRVLREIYGVADSDPLDFTLQRYR
jgi:hypothetical protein